MSDINDLLERLEGAQKMMKQLRRGGGMPGMGGLPGMGGGPGRKAKAKGKGKTRTGGRSGNPAKRAEQERSAATRQRDRRDSAIGSAFGGAGAAGDQGSTPPVDPSNVTLPKGFEKFLGN